jgi:hypothetical protein
LAVDQHLAAARLELPADQPQQGRLAATGTTHDGHDLAARDLQADAVEDRSILVGKIKILDLDKIIGRHAQYPDKNERELYLTLHRLTVNYLTLI